MDGKMIFNLEDANLPTEGGAWDAMLEHVRQHASYDEIFADGKPEIHDLFDDDDIVEEGDEEWL